MFRNWPEPALYLRRRMIGIFAFVVLALANPAAFGQVPQSTATPPIQSVTTPPQRPQPSPESSPTPSADGRPVLYGTQGVLVETRDGKVVSAQSEYQGFNPASAVKLATALIALRTFGPQHRFATGVWADGTLDKATGVLSGNLYVSGRDPSFHYEHAISLARELNNLGIKQVTGDLVIAPGFTMNFNSSSRRSGEQLYDTLDSTLRHADAINAWNYQRALLKESTAPETVPSVAVMNAVLVGPVAPNAKLLLTQKSSKLVDILKVLLCYSNNFMAERIGEGLGGPSSVQQQLTTLLGVGPSEIRLSSLSGLGSNRISPAVMMKIYRALLSELKKNGLSPSDILPVAGIDPGTLKERFTGPAWRGSVIAKTGTLVRTDGGASALVGEMKSASGEVLYFVIMNQRGSVVRFRENQDYLVMLIQNTRGGPKSFDYKPIMLSMQLSDTESSVAASEEYEPKIKGEMSHP
ncbi:MAG TPA: D-alanyl-D-alanine carboxypeptidase [Pyrinomonadaceae bacterium]|nr:D-alanyl-D-alanine carboxypeptidase [Pyrinomonadaceae bacterium]